MLDDGSGLVRGKQKRRTAEERAAIVAETYEPGATVAGVARRHGIVASQLSSWRTAAKRKAVRDKGAGPAFTEIAIPADVGPMSFDGIEVVVGSVVIRLPKNTLRDYDRRERNLEGKVPELNLARQTPPENRPTVRSRLN